MIKRNILNRIEHWLGREKVLILKGARQVGKTTIMQALQSKLENQGKSTVYLEADDLGKAEIFSSSHNFVEYLNKYHHLGKKFTYVFIDEVQYIKEAGLWLKNIFDQHKEKLQLIISGSSSLELTKNTEFLTGRALNFYIPRVSFLEYFSHLFQKEFKKIPLSEDFVREIRSFYEISQGNMQEMMISMMEFGGYPEVLMQENIADKKDILKSIVKTYLEKDIAYFFSIKNISSFNNFLKIINAQISNLLNKNNISKTLGLDNSYISHYLDILEGTYVCSLVKPYFSNIKKELTKMPKFFTLDLGLKNSLLSSFDEVREKIDLGAEIENFILIELLNHFEADQIHFYRTVSGSEIDFVIEKSFNELILIEVKYREKSNPKISLSMKNFINRYQDKKISKIIVTKNLLDFRDDIYFVPACLFPFLDLKTK